IVIARTTVVGARATVATVAASAISAATSTVASAIVAVGALAIGLAIGSGNGSGVAWGSFGCGFGCTGVKFTAGVFVVAIAIGVRCGFVGCLADCLWLVARVWPATATTATTSAPTAASIG